MSLSLPALGIRTSLERLTLTPVGTLAVPRNPQHPGWYVDSAIPGEIGPAVIAGHVDSRSGPAVFYRLADLRPGDAVAVGRSDGGTARFQVLSVRRYAKDRFPTLEVYGATPEPTLRLITCGGTYDRARGYRDNIVVFAAAA